MVHGPRNFSVWILLWVNVPIPRRELKESVTKGENVIVLYHNVATLSIRVVYFALIFSSYFIFIYICIPHFTQKFNRVNVSITRTLIPTVIQDSMFHRG